MRTIDARAAVPAERSRVARGRATATGLVRSLRPRQWTKNLLVFAAAGAGGALLRGQVLGRSTIAFVALCMVSSAGYVLNDVVDAPSDRQHPVRSSRPIAAEIVSVRAATVMGVVVAVAGFAVSATLGPAFLATVGIYAALAASYTLALKRVAVIDIAVVSAGFVVRAVAGSVASGIPLSQWFLILISFGALFVVAGKRYAEFAAMGDRIAHARTPMLEYTAEYLRYVWMLASAVAIAAYCLWAFDQPHAAHHVPWSELSAIPFVLAILRYALVLEAGRGGAPEDVLVSDVPFVLLVGVWLVVYGCGVYLGR